MVMPSPVQTMAETRTFQRFPILVMTVRVSPTLTVPGTLAPHSPDFSFSGVAVVMWSGLSGVLAVGWVAASDWGWLSPSASWLRRETCL